MSEEQKFFELMDEYVKGTLSPADRKALEEKRGIDPEFHKKVSEHLDFIKALKFTEHRLGFKEILNDAHEETLKDQLVVKMVPPAETSFFKKYWPMIGVAASVALVSVLGTVLITNSLEDRHYAIYKELRGSVENIKKSQKVLADNMKQKRLAPSTYSGTGFLISSQGYLTTSYHVIKTADSVYVQNQKYGVLKTDVVYADPASDIAILKINDKGFAVQPSHSFTIVPEEANLGEGVFTLGFPREDIVFGEGSVSALTGFKQDTNAYQVSVPVNPGNSGGPLLNANGDVIGIISGTQTETNGAAFAIKSKLLMEVLSKMPPDSTAAPLALPKWNNMKNMNKVQRIKRSKDYVFMVKVYKN